MSEPKEPQHEVKARFWPWIVLGLCTMLTFVWRDNQELRKQLRDDNREWADKNIKSQAELTKAWKELFYKSERVVAVTNGIDSSRDFDSSAGSHSVQPN